MALQEKQTARQEYNKLYYIKNKQKMLERTRIWRENNRAKIKQTYEDTKATKQQAYYHKNKTKLNAYNRKYYSENKEKLRLYQQKHREKPITETEKEVKKQKRKVWLDANKDNVKAYYNANKEKIQKQIKIYRKENKEKIQAKDRETCVCECGRTILKRSIKKHRTTNIHMRCLVELELYGRHLTPNERTKSSKTKQLLLLKKE